MRNSQRFEGLEEDEITWHSNVVIGCQKGLAGLEEDEITWHSNQHSPQLVNRVGLEGCEIAGYSNIKKSKSRCFVRKQNYMVLKPYSR